MNNRKLGDYGIAESKNYLTMVEFDKFNTLRISKVKGNELVYCIEIEDSRGVSNYFNIGVKHFENYDEDIKMIELIQKTLEKIKVDMKREKHEFFRN